MTKLKWNEDREEVVAHELLSNAMLGSKCLEQLANREHKLV